MYVLTELGYVLICHVKEKRKKKCSFENALVEKSESSTRNKNGLVEGLLLFSIFNPPSSPSWRGVHAMWFFHEHFVKFFRKAFL